MDVVYEVNGVDLDKIFFCKIEFYEKLFILVFLNVYGFNLVWEDEKFCNVLFWFDYLMCDGIGMKMVDVVLGKRLGYNMNGLDFIFVLFD